MVDAPKNVDEVKKDAKLAVAYMAYAKRRAILNEIMFYWNKGNNYKLFFEKYLGKKAKEQVNVSGTVTDAAEKLAAIPDWEHKAWPAIVAQAKKEVGSALNGDIGQFSMSQEFKDVLLKEKMGDPTKAAKLLGISDPKKLKAMMEAQVVGDSKTAKKLWEEIAKKEKAKDKYEVMVKNLEKAGLV